MGIIYKGFNLDEMISVVRAVKEKQVSGQWLVDLTTVANANAYFQQIKMPELGTLLRLGYDKYFVENIATRAIVLDGQGNVTGNDNVNSEIPVLGDLLGFANKANQLGNVVFSLPVIGEVLQGLTIISTVIGVFTSEARTKSFNMKNMLGDKANSFNYTQYQGVVRDVRRVGRISLIELSSLRPKCATGSPSCSLEHLRFDLRGQLQIAGSEKIIELVSQFFNEENFKSFIDSWQQIKSQIINIIPDPNIGGGGGGQVTTSGCLGSAFIIASIPTALTMLYFLLSS